MGGFSENNQFNDGYEDTNPNVFLGQLETKVNKTMQGAESAELPLENYKQKLTQKVFGTNEENAQKALQNEINKGTQFTKQQAHAFVTNYKKEHPLEERISTAVDLVDSSLSRIETNLPGLSTYIDKAELLAIMSKETNLDSTAVGSKGESGYFHLMPDRIRGTKEYIANKKVVLPATNEDFSSCVLGIVSFLMYKQKSLNSFSLIKQPNLAQREKNRLVRLAHNKGISTTEKIVALAYAKYKNIQKHDANATRKFDYVYQVIYEMAGFDTQNYLPRGNMQKQQSYQFLKLAVVDYGTVEKTAIKPLSSNYPLSPYRASVALRYMLTIEALTDQLK